VFMTARRQFGHRLLYRLVPPAGAEDRFLSAVHTKAEDEHVQAGRPAVETGIQVVKRSAPDLPTPSPWWDLLRNRSLVLLTIAYAAVGYYEYLFYFWSQYYFDNVMNVGKEASRGYTSLLYVAMAAGMFSGGWLTDRLSKWLGLSRARRVVPIAGLLLGAVFLG